MLAKSKIVDLLFLIGTLLFQPVFADQDPLISGPSVKLIEKFFRTSLEDHGVRNLAWATRLLSEKGLRADQWRSVILNETGGKKLVIDLNMDKEIISSANELIRQLGMSDFVECKHGDLEAAGPAKPDPKSPEAEVAELSQMAAYDHKGRVASGVGAFISATLLGYLSLSEPKSSDHIAHVTMALTDGPTWKKMAPYVVAGAVSLTYHLMSKKIKIFWGKKLWSPNSFWSRFIIDDALHPLLVVMLASTIAVLPPAIVGYQGMSLIKPFVAMLLSAVSLNLLQSLVTKGIKRNEINPVSNARLQMYLSPVSALGRSVILNSANGLVGALIYLGVFAGVTIPAWLKINYINDIFDRDTRRLLNGHASRWPSVCQKVIKFLAEPPSS